MLRRSWILLLALMLGISAVIPHAHELTESVLAESSHVELEACATPNLHLHAAHEREVHHVCVACVRQHHAGTPALAHVPGAALESSRATSSHVAVVCLAALFFIPGRGPPR